MTTEALIADVVKLPGVSFQAHEPVHYDFEHQLASKIGSIYKCFLIGHAAEPAGAGTTLVRVKFVSPFRQPAPKFVIVPPTDPTVTFPTVTFTLPHGAKVTPIFRKPNASLLELKEFCYARTLIGEVDGLQNDAELIGETDLIRLIRNLRDLLRCHRFDVLSWLMLQGVDLPANVIADETHPDVGDQSPDRPATPTPDAS